MFDIGFWELVLIGAVVLFSINPERFPEFAKESSLWINRVRRLIGNTKREIHSELGLLEQRDLESSLNDVDELIKNAPDNKTNTSVK